MDPAAEALVENRPLMSSERSDVNDNLRSTDIIETHMNYDQSAGVFDINQKNETTLESVCEDLCEDDNMFENLKA